jgi:DNA-binding response OmpR family regulator
VKPKTILIVDDDPDLVLGLTVRLRAKGYRVLSAVDATSALETNREKPDLLILDLSLPGADGFSVLEQIQAPNDKPATPTIVLSGRSAVGNKDRALKAGAVAYFQKPPENNALLNAISLALGGAGAFEPATQLERA